MNFGINMYKNVAVCIVMFTILVACFVPPCFAIDQAEANNTISQAEQNLNAAYVSVASASGTGVNVSVLLNELNKAVDFLSQAYVALEAGNYDVANRLATDCSNTVDGIASEAANLKMNAEQANSISLLSRLLLSFVGVVLVLFLGFVGWRMLKRKYLRRPSDIYLKVRFYEL
jgi:hypothetical protein